MEIIQKVKDIILPKYPFKGNVAKYLGSLIPLFLFVAASVSVVIYKILITINDNLVIPDEIKSSIYVISLLLLLFGLFIRVIIQIRQGNGSPTSKDLSPKMFLILMLLIMGVFTAFKLPNFDNSFAGRRPLKYNTYVEPALYMYERNDPLYMQRKYLHNPVTDSQGLGYTFDNIPLLEWMLYGTFKLTYKSLGLTVSTRLLTHAIGLGIIGALGFLLSKLFSKRLAILSIFMLAINPIFNIATFITVYDALNLLLFLVATCFIVSAINQKKPPLSYLITAGLIFGVAIAVKANTLIWGAPLIILLILSLYNGQVQKSVPTIGLLGIFAVIPQLMTHFGIRNLPFATTNTYLIIGIFIIGIIILVLLRHRIFQLLLSIAKILERYKKRSIISILTIGVVSIVLLIIYMPDRLSSEFITDSRLILNFDLYRRMFREQLVPYLTLPVFVMGLFAIPTMLVKEKKRELLLVFAFAFASLLYAIIASKSLYFHSYYWLIIIVSSMVIASKVLLYGLRGLSYSAQSFVITLFAAAMILHTKPLVHSKIGTDYPEINDLATYVAQNMVDGDVYIDEANASTIIFETGLYKLYSGDFFYTQEVRDLVAEQGFIATMDEYHIRYIVTPTGVTPDFTRYIPAFSEKLEQISTLRRTDIIYAELYPNKYEFYPDGELRAELIEEYKVETFFCKIEVFGRYTLYKITDECGIVTPGDDPEAQ